MSLQKKYTVFVAVIIAIACAVVPWLYLPYSEPFLVDEGYQAMCVKYYQKSPMAMLTFYIGNLWMSCFGDEFLTLRYLSCLLGSLAVTAGSLYFFLRTKNVLWTLLVFSLSMLGCAIERNICYDWDVGAIPFYVLGAITSVEFIRTPKYRNAFFCGRIISMCLARAATVGGSCTSIYRNNIYCRLQRPKFMEHTELFMRCNFGICCSHIPDVWLSRELFQCFYR